MFMERNSSSLNPSSLHMALLTVNILPDNSMMKIPSGTLINQVVIFLLILLQCNDDPPVLSDVTDIALDHFFVAHQVNVADEFHLNQPPVFRL